MQTRRFARVRRPVGGLAARFFIKFSFRNFVWVVLLLATIILLPQMYLHTKIFTSQGRQQDCKWLSRPPLVCAHGGHSSEAPPNTEAAYLLALNLQVDCIEIDASRTQDGVLVALHDRAEAARCQKWHHWGDRVNGRFKSHAYTVEGRDLQAISGIRNMHVGNLNFSQIKGFNPGARYHEKFHKQQVPTLEAALQFVAPNVKQVIIDVKVGPPSYEDNMAVDVFSAIRNVGCSNCVMWAKADSIVQDFMRLSSDPELLGYIVMKDKATRKVTSLLRMEGASIVGAFHGIVTTKLVNTAQRAGKKVYAWTVDGESVMVQMLRAGVDGMVTSFPNVLQHVMGSERQQCAVNGFL